MGVRRVVRAATVWSALIVSVATPAVPAGAAAAAPDEPGVEILGPAEGDCPTSFTCLAFRASCATPAEVPPLTGRFAIGRHGEPRRGILVGFGGGGGQSLWFGGNGGRPFWKQIAHAGIEAVSVAWDADWNLGTQGPAALACRVAAVVDWAIDRDAAAGTVPPAGDGVCGVCVLGYSIGTAQAAAALSSTTSATTSTTHLGLGPADRRHRRRVPPRRVGPPVPQAASQRHAVAHRRLLRRRCRRLRALFDGAGRRGYFPAWNASSLVPAGRTHFPTTRFSFVWGDRDRTGAAGQGITYLGALEAAGSPLLGYRCSTRPTTSSKRSRRG